MHKRTPTAHKAKGAFQTSSREGEIIDTTSSQGDVGQRYVLLNVQSNSEEWQVLFSSSLSSQATFSYQRTSKRCSAEIEN